MYIIFVRQAETINTDCEVITVTCTCQLTRSRHKFNIRLTNYYHIMTKWYLCVYQKENVYKIDVIITMTSKSLGGCLIENRILHAEGRAICIDINQISSYPFVWLDLVDLVIFFPYLAWHFFNFNNVSNISF